MSIDVAFWESPVAAGAPPRRGGASTTGAVVDPVPEAWASWEAKVEPAAGVLAEVEEDAAGGLKAVCRAANCAWIWLMRLTASE